MRRRRLVSAVALGFLAGCTGLGGLVGGTGDQPDAAPGSDAAGAEESRSGDEPDAGGADVARDADVLDVAEGDRLDPLGEAGCAAAPHDFCDDFDRAPLGASWSRSAVTGGTLSLDPLAVSPPSALLAAAADGGGSEQLLLVKDFAGRSGGLACAFDLRVDAFDDFTVVLQLWFVVPSQPPYLLRVAVGNGGDLNEYGQNPDGSDRVRNNWPFAQPAAKTWVHVVLDVKASGGAGKARLTLDGTDVLLVPLLPPDNATSMSIKLGAENSGAVRWVARYDNVACDLAP
jgi:hypothetical protein